MVHMKCAGKGNFVGCTPRFERVHQANLRPEIILATAQVFVTLHNDILSAPMEGGFALLDNKVPQALMENSALFDFGEMASIGPWINKQGVLVLDFVFDTGLKNA